MDVRFFCIAWCSCFVVNSASFASISLVFALAWRTSPCQSLNLLFMSAISLATFLTSCLSDLDPSSSDWRVLRASVCSLAVVAISSARASAAADTLSSSSWRSFGLATSFAASLASDSTCFATARFLAFASIVLDSSTERSLTKRSRSDFAALPSMEAETSSSRFVTAYVSAATSALAALEFTSDSNSSTLPVAWPICSPSSILAAWTSPTMWSPSSSMVSLLGSCNMDSSMS